MPTFMTLEDVHRRMQVGSLGAILVSEFRESVLLDMLRIKNITGAHDEFRRETQLPTPQRRAVHEEFTRTRSTTTIGTEGLRIFGTKMSHDRFLERTGNLDIVAELRSHTKAIRLLIESELVFGDPFDEDDPGQIMGLQFLAENSLGKEAETSISAGTTSGGAPLSLRGLQDAIDLVHPTATMLICGQEMKNVITTGSRDAVVSGHINYIEASFGRKVETFNGLPIFAMNRDHLNNRILTFTEPAFAGPATASSIYIVSQTPEEGGWYLFQNGGPFTEEDSGTAAPLKDRNLEWYLATNRPQPTAVVRLKHIGLGPMVP